MGEGNAKSGRQKLTVSRFTAQRTLEILRGRGSLAAVALILNLTSSAFADRTTIASPSQSVKGTQPNNTRDIAGLQGKPAGANADTPTTGIQRKSASASSATSKSEAASGAPGPDPTTEVQYARSLSRAFREVAKRVGPSVVSITTIDRAPFSNEFGRSSPNSRPTNPMMPQRGERRGEGTGIVYSQNGLIITNNHVVAGGDEITVRFSDGREMTAQHVGSDPETDLAIIRVDANDLHAATFDASNAIETGDWVLAIGCPFGLQQTVTAGIISAKGRDGVGLSTFEEYIQTDAAINPGNSGGPLIDLDANVVGINSGIASNSGANTGIGFAIPSHIIKRVAESISRGEPVRRGWLGIAMQEMNHELAQSFGQTSKNGVLISGVAPGTPAAKAGLKAGDIIVDIDGKDTLSVAQVMRLVASSAPNSSITLGFIRAGHSLTAEATLGERPTTKSKPTTPQPVTPDIENSLGLEIRALDNESATALGVTGEGVYVAFVLEGGPAQIAGIALGDVIREIAGIKVTTVAQCRVALMRAMTGKTGMTGQNNSVIRILFERDGAARFTMVKPLPS